MRSRKAGTRTCGVRTLVAGRASGGGTKLLTTSRVAARITSVLGNSGMVPRSSCSCRKKCESLPSPVVPDVVAAASNSSTIISKLTKPAVRTIFRNSIKIAIRLASFAHDGRDGLEGFRGKLGDSPQSVPQTSLFESAIRAAREYGVLGLVSALDFRTFSLARIRSSSDVAKKDSRNARSGSPFAGNGNPTVLHW